MARIDGSGEASDETSYYPALLNLLNRVGGTLAPQVLCVLTPKNRGAGVPDGGFFIKRDVVLKAGAKALMSRHPEHGVMEVKGLQPNVKSIAMSGQVRKYLDRFGRVLVTNYREFVTVSKGDDQKVVLGERFKLADSEDAFWALAAQAKDDELPQALPFEEFVRRVLSLDAPLSSPEHLAWFLAAYARVARERIDQGGKLNALKQVRDALEQALGLRFTGTSGEDFFRSALVQTLFYGVFAAWVVWSEQQPLDSEAQFSWKEAQWTLDVPMVRVLFAQLASPATLPVGLNEVLDWTEEVLRRVDRRQFFKRFEAKGAVQYFYEPFLKAYDPNLRKELGVWYTPPEVVRYMVARVHESLKRDLNLKLGLADENVHILDPCTGTGSFLVEAIRVISDELQAEQRDALVAQQVKKAALERVHGFELLPAPFVVAHLQLGLMLDQLGAPLTPGSGERASVYLTNALTGWVDEPHKELPFEEFERERDAAEHVKRTEPILVVLGNPPYNGFAGVSGEDEGGLATPYKQGLSDEPWLITKNKLDDLYIRFFRVAERRIAERSRRGIVCFISNLGWLGDPSTVVMRKRLVDVFDRMYIDNLNGDSRETGKHTPEGKPDPSIFSSKVTSGIQVGTAVSLLVRTDPHSSGNCHVLYRDFWGQEKHADLIASLDQPQVQPTYTHLTPVEDNWFRLRPWAPRQGYGAWPAVDELAAASPKLGLNQNRDDGLVAIRKADLEPRIKHFLSPEIPFDELDRQLVGPLLQPWARYQPKVVREALLDKAPYDPTKIVRFQVGPFDVRYAYVETHSKLWNESRAEYVKASELGSDFLLVRRRAPRAFDGAAFLLSRCLIDQHVLHKDASTIPMLLPAEADEDAANRLFAIIHEADDAPPWRANLSEDAQEYLRRLGFADGDSWKDAARLLWMHTLAIGYAPLYLEENGDAIRNDWPRIPLPDDPETLLASARHGERIAALLDIDTSLPGVDTHASPLLGAVAAITRENGGSVAAGDLLIEENWGVQQVRTTKAGAVTHAVMPGNGRFDQRERTDTELATVSDEQTDLLGEEVIDVYLNDRVCWRGVPQAAWDFKIGGFQVLRKWLSYRANSVMGRELTFEEARQFRDIARRLTELVLLQPKLDRNYRAATGDVTQDSLWRGLGETDEAS